MKSVLLFNLTVCQDPLNFVPLVLTAHLALPAR